jgi:hypothetical protein
MKAKMKGLISLLFIDMKKMLRHRFKEILLIFLWGCNLMPIQAQTSSDLYNTWRSSVQGASRRIHHISFTQHNILQVEGRFGRDELATDMRVQKAMGMGRANRTFYNVHLNNQPIASLDELKTKAWEGKRYLIRMMREIPFVEPGLGIFWQMKAGEFLVQESYNNIPTYKIRLIVPEFGTQIEDVFVWLAKDDKRLVAAQFFLKPFQGESAATIRERFKMDVIYERQHGLDIPKFIQSQGSFKRPQRNRMFHTIVTHKATYSNYEFSDRN